MVVYGSDNHNLFCKLITPDILNKIILGSFIFMQSRKVPGPESSKDVTYTIFLSL